MSDPKEWSGPGAILSFFKLRDSSSISEKTLEEWFEREYVPALYKAGIIKMAWLYQAANAKYNKQNLIMYKIPDLTKVGRMQAIPRTSALSLFGGPVDEHIEVDSRIYSNIQLYGTLDHREEAAPVMMLAMMQPAQGGGADLDAWYRNEHNEQMSKEPGYWRTSRFTLLHQGSTGSQQSEKLSFLAVHEFDENSRLGTEVKALEPISDWTKKVMSEAQAIDAAIYHKRRDFEDDGNRA